VCRPGNCDIPADAIRASVRSGPAPVRAHGRRPSETKQRLFEIALYALPVEIQPANCKLCLRISPLGQWASAPA